MASFAHLPARRLAPGEPCPVLHRYPGPCGLALWFAGRLERLGPGEIIWMSAAVITPDSLGAHLFGTLVVSRPRAFAPRVFAPGVYVARNRRLRPDDEIDWRAPAGQGRAQVIDGLCRYLEELDAMRRSGAPGPGVPWLCVPAAERRRQLQAARVTPVWTESESAGVAPCYNPVP
jgi:hypothetical protein